MSSNRNDVMTFNVDNLINYSPRSFNLKSNVKLCRKLSTSDQLRSSLTRNHYSEWMSHLKHNLNVTSWVFKHYDRIPIFKDTVKMLNLQLYRQNKCILHMRILYAQYVWNTLKGWFLNVLTFKGCCKNA